MTKPYLNVNQFFQRGNTDGFSEAGSAAAAAQFLDRRHPREDLRRRVFPSALKSSDYIYNGRYSRRYTIGAGENITVTMDSAPVQPGMIITCAVQFRINFESISSANVPRLELTGSLAGGGTLTAQQTPVGGSTPIAVGVPFNYLWDAATTSMRLTGLQPVNAGIPWYGVAFTMEIPPLMTTFGPILRANGPSAGSGEFDLGEFSLQAQLSVDQAQPA